MQLTTRNKSKQLRAILIASFTIISLSTLLSVQQYSSGAASNGTGDMTGNSPFSFSNCGTACHNDNAYSTTINLQLLDEQGNPVSSYLANNTYTLEFTASGASPYFGMQALALLNSDNTVAGTYGTVNSQNTQISYFGGRPYVEQDSRAPTNGGNFVFSVDWTAPTSGSGEVNVYAIAVGANGDNSFNGDGVSLPQTFSIQEDAFSGVVDLNTSTPNFYPNPTEKTSKLMLDKIYKSIEAKVYTLNGKLVNQFNTSNTNNISVNLEGEAGTYLVKISTNGKPFASYQLIKSTK